MGSIAHSDIVISSCFSYIYFQLNKLNKQIKLNIVKKHTSNLKHYITLLNLA